MPTIECEHHDCDHRQAAAYCTECNRYWCAEHTPARFAVTVHRGGPDLGHCAEGYPCALGPKPIPYSPRELFAHAAPEPEPEPEPRPYQLGLNSHRHPPQGQELTAQVEWVLATHPETRGNDVALVIRCWLYYDGLAQELPKAAQDWLVEWANTHPTSPETYRRRRQEAQRLRSLAGALRPDPATIAHRRSRDGAGPPRRRKS